MTVIKTWNEKLGPRTKLSAVLLKDGKQLERGRELHSLSPVMELDLFLDSRLVRVVIDVYTYYPDMRRNANGQYAHKYEKTYTRYYPLEQIAYFHLQD